MPQQSTIPLPPCNHFCCRLRQQQVEAEQLAQLEAERALREEQDKEYAEGLALDQAAAVEQQAEEDR